MVKYRIHISLIFVFLLINVYKLIAKTPVNWPVVWAFGLWHFALYIFDRAYDYQLDAINQPQEAVLPKERRFILWLSVALCLIPVIILLWFKLNVVPYLPFIPITFLYTYPLVKNKRSKNILIFKNVYSALLIWTLPLATVCYYYTNLEMSLSELYSKYFLGMFIYVMVGEAFWDIRDVEGDRTQNVNTIPVVFDVGITKIYLLALIFGDYCFVSHRITFSSMIYVVLICLVNQKTPRWVFHLPPLLALFQFLQTLF